MTVVKSAATNAVNGDSGAKLTHASWDGKWELSKRREDWTSYLSFLGVPEAAHELAIKAPDFHEYKMSSSNFFMDHKIPAQNMHLRFTAALEDSYQTCPYPRPTVKGFSSDGEEAKPFSGKWKNTWISEPTSFKTEIPDFAGLGKTVVLTRTLTSASEMEADVTVYDGDKVVLETSSWFSKTSDEPPLTHESWNGKWELTKRREDWTAYLKFLNVPEAAHEMAIKAPDFHEYRMSTESFFMDHQIPAQKMHLQFTAFFGDDYQPCPYPRPTVRDLRAK